MEIRGKCQITFDGHAIGLYLKRCGADRAFSTCTIRDPLRAFLSTWWNAVFLPCIISSGISGMHDRVLVLKANRSGGASADYPGAASALQHPLFWLYDVT